MVTAAPTTYRRKIREKFDIRPPIYSEAAASGLGVLRWLWLWLVERLLTVLLSTIVWWDWRTLNSIPFFSRRLCFKWLILLSSSKSRARLYPVHGEILHTTGFGTFPFSCCRIFSEMLLRNIFLLRIFRSKVSLSHIYLYIWRLCSISGGRDYKSPFLTIVTFLLYCHQPIILIVK